MHTSDIYPVSDFNRKPAEHIKRVQETKKPEVLTRAEAAQFPLTKCEKLVVIPQVGHGVLVNERMEQGGKPSC